MSLLIAEGRTVIDVAGQAGHSPETRLCYYAHLFASSIRACAPAEELIPQAREDAGGYSEHAADDDQEAA